MKLAYSATCAACGPIHDGDDADKAAERHVKATGHSVTTRATPERTR